MKGTSPTRSGLSPHGIGVPRLKFACSIRTRGEVMDKITTVGIDLAKNVFSVHGVDALGKAVLRRTVRRGELESVVATLPACVIGMEACSGAHEWARRFA